MIIQNKRDLKIAYECLVDLVEMMRTERKCDPVKANAHIISLKKDIRNFNKKHPYSEFPKIVDDNGIDGYTELIRLPDGDFSIEELNEYVEENVWIRARPSMYDCTGQAFTTGFKVCKRRGMNLCYHTVCFDV